METGAHLVIADTEDLQILFEAGTTDTAIVSFTGVGLELGGIQEIEFARTLRTQEETDSVFYVIDRKRSWFNGTRDEIVRHLHPRLLGYAKVATLGNSMGGFGALYFSGLLPNCRRAIGFVPQFSVTLDTPDPRWTKWRSQVRNWVVQHALENLTDTAPALVLFGKGEPEDEWHIDQFRSRLRDPHKILVATAGGHKVAKTIRRRGLLPQLISEAIRGTSGNAIAEMFADAGLPCR